MALLAIMTSKLKKKKKLLYIDLKFKYKNYRHRSLQPLENEMLARDRKGYNWFKL